VSAPNEPGQPGPGEIPDNGNGSADPAATRPAPGANGGSGEVPPWQRGAARARQGATPARPAADVGARPEPRPAAASAAPSIEARVNRFITGTAAPDLSTLGEASEARQDPEAAVSRPESRVERTEVARPEVYASELPDLSGPVPKPVQPRKPVPDRPAAAEPAAAKAAAPAAPRRARRTPPPAPGI
jgi:hypothetical protein